MATHEHISSAAGSLPDAPPVHDHHGNKSFKRKYAKQKVHFENVMRESNALYKEEMRIQKLSRRLKEQNDQLLELLLEFNSSVRVPPPLRYDMQLPGEPPLDQDDIPPVPYGPATAKQQLEEAKSRLLAGEISADACRRLEASILKGEAFAPAVQYASLLNKVPHSELDTNGFHQSMEDEIDTTLGFLSPAHDAEFSAAVDATTAGQQPNTGEKQSPTERDRELAFRNPVSVYNWLRKNQPQVFLQDKDADAASEKGGAAAGTRSTNTRSAKRQSAAHARKEEEIAYDEDGIALEPANATSSRGKRKRDEDGGYRPKGGSGGGRSRKKKDDGAKRSKRSSVAGSAE